VPVRAIFVGLEDERAALEHALRALEIEGPLLTVGSRRVRLSGASGVPGLDDFDHRHEGGCRRRGSRSTTRVPTTRSRSYWCRS
jgi:hypothetical protein